MLKTRLWHLQDDVEGLAIFGSERGRAGTELKALERAPKSVLVNRGVGVG